jgi:DNA polymerase I-like protein with 3'-5' exonuclease and polymerase domains
VASLHFTQNLTRHTDCPTAQLPAATVNELFERYFESWPAVRDYVLDNQGEVRHHVKVLVDGRNLRDRRKLTDSLKSDSEVYVFQALSGG